MSAELVVHLMERGLNLDQAKHVDSLNPGSEAELVIAVMETVGGSLQVAKDVAEGAPLLPAHLPLKQAPRRGPSVEPTFDDGEDLEAAESFRPSRNRGLSQGELKQAEVEQQLARGVGLCPNCQQSNADHAPGCARSSGEDPRAVTRQALPPLA